MELLTERVNRSRDQVNVGNFGNSHPRKSWILWEFQPRGLTPPLETPIPAFLKFSLGMTPNSSFLGGFGITDSRGIGNFGMRWIPAFQGEENPWKTHGKSRIFRVLIPRSTNSGRSCSRNARAARTWNVTNPPWSARCGKFWEKPRIQPQIPVGMARRDP